MIIILNKNITEKEKSNLHIFLSDKGFHVREIFDEKEKLLGAVGSLDIDHQEITVFPGVSRVIRIKKPYKMASRDFHPEDSVIKIGGVKIGGARIVMIAGPCAVESREQILDIAWAVKEAGAVMLRGGAYKPRSSPYAFQGLGIPGLKYLKAAGEATGMPVVSEVVSPNDVDLMSPWVDCFQIGTRNMQNFELLKKVGASGIPTILKRGMAATVEEWLMAAEYILSSGNDQVILCERGIRTFERATRNTLDLSAIPVVKELSHLPVIVDPSHATGLREKVSPMALAGIAAGAHGLIIEVHTNPEKAFSDGPQSLWPVQYEKLVCDVEALCPTINKEMARLPERHQKTRFHSPLSDASSDKKPKVAFQGEYGAYSERAILNYFPEGTVETLASPQFQDIFKQVLTGAASWGILPMENSLAGSIHENFDLLSQHPDIKIVGEITLRIRHNLVVSPGVKESQLTRVYSHPQALSQCREYLQKKSWEAMPYFDTAGAAAMVSREKNPSIAAIAGGEAARFYKLEILSESIETNPHNYTRFVLIAALDSAVPEHRDKASLTFSLPDHPGALTRCLAVFAAHEINLSKLESRPIAGKPWNYIFYVDIMLPQDPEVYIKAEKEIRKITGEYRNLGHYASHR